MNRRTHLNVFATISLAAALSVVSLLTGCSSSSSSSSAPPPPPTIVVTATSGVTQSAAINTAVAGSAFAALGATVTSNGSPASGTSVTFTAPTTGASCTFASNGTNTETDTTNSSGVATSSVCTANGTVGGYTVAATVTGATAPANFSLTNLGWNNYVYYWSGQEVPNSNNGDLVDYYAVAGAVQMDTNGDVLGGEQDYNDAFGVTSPGEPNTPDTIALADGALVVNATTGAGTLTLTSSYTVVGVKGVETLVIQFVNSNHAFITEFDGTATSSGSFDLQTATSATPGNFAFTLSGVDPGYYPVAFGGVFTAASGTATSTNTFDVNDDGTVSTGNSFSATVTSGSTVDPMGLGRSVVTGITNPVADSNITLAAYTVGPEVIRLIDVDNTTGDYDSAIGSAFGQGTNGTSGSNASLGASVFGVQGNPFSTEFAALGLLTTNTTPTPATFSGVGEDNELGNGVQDFDATIGGNYSIAADGYGSMTFTSTFGDVENYGLYMTDPTLNLNDPNNTTANSDLGGGLLLDLDDSLPGGTGVVTPQTDASTAVADFNGSYAAGWQNFNSFSTTCIECETDMLAQGTMTSGGALSLTGVVSDPLGTLTASAESTGDTFTSTPAPDPDNPGRYTASLAVTINSVSGSFNVAIYQGNGEQLFWTETDVEVDSVFSGPVEQQGSLSSVPLIKGPGVRNVKNDRNRK